MNGKYNVHIVILVVLVVLVVLVAFLAGSNGGSRATIMPDVQAGAGARPATTLVLSVPASLEVHEGSTAVFLFPSATLTAGRSVKWSIAGTDAACFDIDPATGALSFRQPPDTARPCDADGDNDYDLIMRVSDGQRDSQATVKVHVLD